MRLRSSRRVEGLALTGVIALGAVAFLWRLGTSSLFIDETFSWRAASSSLGGVFHGVRSTEVAPPLYYLLLHFWIAAFGDATEWGMRLLSVLAALAFVAAVWWLGRLVAGRGAGLLAALLAAVSPLAVQYAQELRAYAFVMASVTVAAAAAIEAVRRPSGPGPWLTVSALASVASIWLHYTALLVIVPLLVFVYTAPELTRRVRRAYALSCAAALAIVAPLLILQLRAGHQGGVAPFAKPTATNLARVVGTPFDGRFVPHALTYVTGAIAVVVSVAWLAARPRVVGGHREQRLVLAAAVAPPAVILAVTVLARLLGRQSDYALISRYTAVAAPFMLVAIAATVTRLPRPAGVTLGAVVAVAVISGLSSTYSTLWPNLRSPFQAISRGYHPGDAVVLAGSVAEPGDADYYVARLRGRRPGAIVAPLTVRRPRLPAAPKRLWVVSDFGAQALASNLLARAGWRAAARHAYRPGIQLILASR